MAGPRTGRAPALSALEADGVFADRFRPHPPAGEDRPKGKVNGPLLIRRPSARHVGDTARPWSRRRLSNEREEPLSILLSRFGAFDGG